MPDGSNSSVLHDVTLDDKFTSTTGKVFLSGIQALVRLPMMQQLRDARDGLNTGGFISGYRGSRWAAWTRPCGRRRSTWKSIMCNSFRA